MSEANTEGNALRTTTLSTKEAATYLGIGESTLAQWRLRGQGPAYMRFGGRVRYRPADLEAWMDGLVVDPGGEEAAGG